MVPLAVVQAIGATFLGALVVQLPAYLVGLRLKRVDVVDTAWGLSFIGGIIGLHTYLHSTNPTALVVDSLVVIWAIRLSWHIYRRFQHSVHQDARYTELMTSGLWRYSRHPNYFGEITLWWGIALIATATPLWWLGARGALTITILLCFISGIPPAEAHAARKKGWAAYKHTTSILIHARQNSNR